MKPATQRYLDLLLSRYPNLNDCSQSIIDSYFALLECYNGGGKILLCGNGGSAADAEHIVGELMKDFVIKRPIPETFSKALKKTASSRAEYLINNLQQTIPAISLVSQTALASAMSNDISADIIFAQQVYGYGKKNDVLIALSTSGNSANICDALYVAKAKGMKSIGLTGKSGGKMKGLCNITVCVPEQETYKIQEFHLPIYHTICLMLESEIFGG